MERFEGVAWLTVPMPWLDGTKWRRFALDVNDGIVATAGLVEGLLGADASTGSTRIAAGAALIAGSLALGGARFSEEAVESDAQKELIEEERRLLALSPEEELAELAEHYRAKGLSPELAQQVANDLTEQNALAAHLSTEYGISLDQPAKPWAAAAVAAAGFAAGSAFVLLLVVTLPRQSMGISTALAVMLSLGVTSFFAARLGRVPVVRTVLRTVSLGVTAMVITFAVGTLFGS